MANSQFTVYSSSDPGNGSDQPGLITGQAGDLIRVLDKVLINGYTGKTAAGWTKPVATSSNASTYKNSGSGMTLHVQDNGPNVTSTFKEAWLTGWENCTAVSSTVGTGNGQFPTPAQLLTSGHVVCRKSTTADSTGRSWTIFADAYTFYMFILTGDTANNYLACGFGDFFSLKNASDNYRCFIMGRGAENTGAASLSSDFDTIQTFGSSTSTEIGLWCPRSFGGGSANSIQLLRCGDATKTGVGSGGSGLAAVGTLQTPNGPDNAYYIAPMSVVELSVLCQRGRFRGAYHVCHALASFADGQQFQGAGDYAGKTFQIVKQGLNAGMWAVEISNTVETN